MFDGEVVCEIEYFDAKCKIRAIFYYYIVYKSLEKWRCIIIVMDDVLFDEGYIGNIEPYFAYNLPV